MLKTEDVRKVLVDLAASHGDTQMQEGTGCYYRGYNGEPLCIVGHVLARLEPEFFRKIPVSRNCGELNSRTIAEVIADGRLLAERDAATLLTYAQTYQDSGASWARSVGWAVEELKRRHG